MRAMWLDRLAGIGRAYRRGGPAEILRAAGREALIRLVEIAKRPIHQDAAPEPCHELYRQFVERVNAMARPRVLEIGARARSGNVRAGSYSNAEYVGFDVLPGENVQVVGDAHELSAHFAAESFDAVFAVSVFEHLAMPWKVVLEVNRVLKPGGLVFVFTHPTWPLHDRPWDFWRYSPEAFEVLFCKAAGYELLKAAQGIRCAVVPLSSDPAVVGMLSHPAYLGVSALARKVGPPDARMRWDVPVSEVVSTRYPE